MATKKLARVFGEFKGEYDPATLHKFLDEVRVQGDGVYRAVKDVPLGTAPGDPEFWVKTISDTKTVPAISSRGIQKFNGNLSYDAGTGTLTVPRFRALYQDADGNLAIKTFLQSTHVIDFATDAGLVVTQEGNLELVIQIDDDTVTRVVNFSFEKKDESDRPLASGATILDFLQSKPLDLDSEYGLVIKISDFGALPNNPDSVTDAFKRADKFLPDGQTIFVDGDYACKSTCRINNRSNISILFGRLYKDPLTWQGEYLLRLDSCQNPRISNLALVGLHGDSLNPNFGEQGLYLRKAINPKVNDCYFQSFGDAGLRCHSGGYDSATVPDQIESFDLQVSGCFFKHCYQNTMTPGGTIRQMWTGNVFLQGGGAAIKSASRVQGAYGVIIAGNIVDGYPNEAFQIQGAKKMSITDNLIMDSHNFCMLSSNSDGVSATYPTPNSYAETNISNNIILNASGRFMYLQNRAFFLNNTEISPDPGTLIMANNYFDQKNTGTEAAPIYQEDVVRFFSHTVTGTGGRKHRANLVKLAVIKGNTFVNGTNWMRTNCAIYDGAKIFLEDNKFIDYTGYAISWSNETQDHFDAQKVEIHVNNNYGNKFTEGFKFTGQVDKQTLGLLQIRGNNLFGLVGKQITSKSTDKAFARDLVIDGNDFTYAGSNGDQAIDICVGDLGDAGNTGGTLKFTRNDIWFPKGSGASARPVYVDAISQIDDHFCHGNYCKGTTGSVKTDSADITISELAVTVLA